jgi:hypothetical protein
MVENITAWRALRLRPRLTLSPPHLHLPTRALFGRGGVRLGGRRRLRCGPERHVAGEAPSAAPFYTLTLNPNSKP